MNTVQIVVLVIAGIEVCIGLYWLSRIAPRFAGSHDKHAEHRRIRNEGGLIQRKSVSDIIMIDDPRTPDYEQPRKIPNPQAFVGIAMVLGGVIVAAVALVFLGD